MTAPEEWRPVAGFPDYAVSDLGRVVSYARTQPRLLSPTVHDTGYPRVQLTRDGVRASRYVHQLVAVAFHGDRPADQEVRHLNGDKLDPRASNLRWGTRSENILDRVAHGTHDRANRTHCPSDHPYDATNTKWYRGRRYCRACKRRRDQDRALRAANTPTSAAA